MTKTTKRKQQAAHSKKQTGTTPTARLATSGGRAPEADIPTAAAALNTRGACMMAFSEFLESGTEEEIELLHSVLMMRAEGIYKDEPLEGLMSQAAYYGERHREEIDRGAENERKAVRAFVDIYRANMGAHTPAENFIVWLVNRFALGETVTPDEAAHSLEEFRGDYQMTVDAARRLLDRNPALFAAKSV